MDLRFLLWISFLTKDDPASHNMFFYILVSVKKTLHSFLHVFWMKLPFFFIFTPTPSYSVSGMTIQMLVFNKVQILLFINKLSLNKQKGHKFYTLVLWEKAPLFLKDLSLTC